MPGITGMELAREVGRIAPDMPVVFLTDSEAYAVEAFDLKALHYVLKPMTEQALKECLNRLEERQGARRRVHIISSFGIQQMLYADEIQYAQSSAHYYDLHLKDGTVIKVRMTQSEIRDTLGDSILNKPTRLTDVEFDIIKSHTTTGGEILGERTVIESARDVALSHHERYDGRGYPRGLSGKEITEEARIVGIADAFDAMNSNRIYRKACDREYILGQLKEGRGKQFDPDYADVLIDLWNRGLLDESLKMGAQSGKVSEKLEASLHEAVETFVSENGSPELLVADIEQAGSYEGAMNVEYSQFAKLYEFIANLEKRFEHPFKLILITLERKDGGDSLSVNLENAMFYMERAIRISIRDVDIVTQYNRQQFLVIMLGTELVGVNIAIDRIFKSYFRMSGSNAFSPSYSIIGLGKKK
jgi:HD-GYP domain